MPDAEMDSFRQDFHNWTLDRVDLHQHLICAGPGAPQAILASVFPKTTFVIANASGAEPARGNLKIDIKQTPAGLRLLMAARWYADHGHWDSAKRGPGWEAPLGFPLADLQVELRTSSAVARPRWRGTSWRPSPALAAHALPVPQ